MRKDAIDTLLSEIYSQHGIRLWWSRYRTYLQNASPQMVWPEKSDVLLRLAQQDVDVRKSKIPGVIVWDGEPKVTGRNTI